MKRKTETSQNGSANKKRSVNHDDRGSFRQGLFDQNILRAYTQQYAQSEPLVLSPGRL